MKTLKTLLISIILSFIYYVSFVKDVLLFEILSWFLLSMALIGIVMPSYKQELLKTKWHHFLLGAPFITFNFWIFFKNGGETFGYAYALLMLIAYYRFFMTKIESK